MNSFEENEDYKIPNLFCRLSNDENLLNFWIRDDLKNNIIQKRQLEIDEDGKLLLKLIDSIK